MRPFTVIVMLKVFSSLFDGDSGILLLEITLDDSGILTVDVVMIMLSGLLSEVNAVFSEVLKAICLLDEFAELDELTELDLLSISEALQPDTNKAPAIITKKSFFIITSIFRKMFLRI